VLIKFNLGALTMNNTVLHQKAAGSNPVIP